MIVQPVSPRIIWAYLALIGLVVAIALVGGGWWALGRADPMLALPGIGWATAALVLLHPQPDRRTASVGVIFLLLLLAVLSSLLANRLPLMQLLCFGLAAWLLIAVTTLLWNSIRRRWPSGWSRRSAALVMTLCVGLLGQALGWPLTNAMFEPATTGDKLLTVDVLTSLPLHPADSFGKQLAGQATSQDPVLMALNHHARVRLVDSVPADAGRAGNVVLLAHPRALAPEQLVAVDSMVRNGGHVLILADGLLSWPMPHALGDPRNPPVSSMLGPLLSHWGLQLDAPAGLVGRRREIYDLGHRLALFSPGRLRSDGGACQIMHDAMMADCRLGRGRAVVVADADLLNAAMWLPVRPDDGHGTEASWSASNPHWLVARLDNLAGVTRRPALARPVWVR